MKYKISILLFATLCSMHRAFAMEPASTNNNDAAIINRVDAEINRQQPNSFVDYLSHYAAVGLGNLAISAGYDPSSISRHIEGNVRKTMNIVPAFPSVHWNENVINDAAIINIIDAEINKQQQPDIWDDIASFTATTIVFPLSGSTCYQLIADSAAKTMATISTFKTIQLNENSINALCTKNRHFKNAVDYYIAHVLNYYKEVTCENLNKAVSYELEHPVAEINKLMPAIKKYIIDNALRKITHEYTMKFSEDHGIESFAICEYDTIHLAATNSSCCDHVSIWNLLTGKLLRRIEKKGDVIEKICFSPSGSQLAATGCSTTDSAAWIKIWNPQSGSLLYVIPQVELGSMLQYQHGSVSNTLLNIKYYDPHLNKLEVWLLDRKDPEYRGYSFIRKPSAEGLRDKATTSYKAAYPFSTSRLDVTKILCPMLYLCERAINRAETTESLQKIEGTRPFIALTDYEKPMIRTAIRNRIEALSEKQLRLHATNKLLEDL